MAEYPTNDRLQFGQDNRVERSKYPRLAVNPSYVRSRYPGDDGQSCLPAPILAYNDGSELRAYHPSPREQIASALMGDHPSLERARQVSGLLGTTGLGPTTAWGGLLDWIPETGIPLRTGDAAHDRDPLALALAVLPLPPALRRLAGPRVSAALDRVATTANVIDRATPRLDDNDLSWFPSLSR